MSFPNGSIASKTNVSDMFKPNLPIDVKEAAAISRRRTAEEERKRRIFNSPVRTIGKDVNAINEQIRVKASAKEHETELDIAWHHETLRQSLLAMEIQRRQAEDIRNTRRNLEQFRKLYQTSRDNRKSDLAPATMPEFGGEDPNYKERIEKQERETKAWLEAQIAEKKRKQQVYKEVDRIDDQRMMGMTLTLMELTKAEAMAQRQVQRAYKQYNQAQAQEIAERSRLQRLAEEEATLTHQFNMIHSELLTEVAMSAYRIPRDRFKGFSEETGKRFKEDQFCQALEKRQREQEERFKNAKWDKLNERCEVVAATLDKDLKYRKLEQLAEVVDINQELAEQQRIRENYMNNLVYRGTITEEFFKQFGTSTR